MAGAAGGGASAMGNSNGTADLLGFGSAPPTPAAPPTSTLGEARAGPGEDPNGIERLTGESDAQYVARQTRLRDEAKARMAAKFGGGGMGGVGSGGGGMAARSQAAAPSSGSYSAAPSSGSYSAASTLGEARAGPGEDPNGIERLTGESDEQYVMRQTRLRDEAKARMAAKFGGGGMSGVGSGGGGMA